MINVKKFIFYLFQENTYVVWDDSRECVIIDPGCERESEKQQLAAFIDAQGLTPRMVLLTHGHLDHIYGARFISERYGVPVMMDPKDVPSMENVNKMFIGMGFHEPPTFEFTPIEDGQLLSFGQSECRVLSTPGHSLGGVCYWFEKDKILFSGDTLFAGSVGRTDNNWASLDMLKDSLRGTLMQLEGDIDVLPGHGGVTSIGQERQSNPFIYEDYTLSELLKADE